MDKTSITLILDCVPVALLMIISLSGFLSGEMIKCDYNRKNNGSGNRIYRYTCCASFVCALFFWMLSWLNFEISPYTAVTALLFGVAVIGQIAASAFAMKIGPWSYTAVMMSFSAIIPALSGAMKSAVFFPIMSGGELIFVTAASQAHHHLNPKNYDKPYMRKEDVKNSHIVSMILYNNCQTNFPYVGQGEVIYRWLDFYFAKKSSKISSK